MTKNSKTGWQIFLYYVWLPFSILMTAVDLIQIGDNFFPALIHWTDFFQYWIDSIRVFRNWLFSPFSWVNLKLTDGIKDYLLFGLFVTSNIIAGINHVTKFISRNIFYHNWKNLGILTLIRNVLSEFLFILILIIIWPASLFSAVLAASSKKIEDNPRQSFVMMLKLMLRVLIITSILILINYFIINAKGR